MKDKLEIVIFVAPNNFHPLKWSNQSTYFYSIQLDHIHKSQQNISIFASHYLGSPITCNHLPPVAYADISYFFAQTYPRLCSIPFCLRCVHSCLTPLCSSDIPEGNKKKKKKTIITSNKGEKTNMSFTGTLDKCTACDKTVYVVDLLTLEGIPYHKNCFKCSHCKGCLTVHIALLFLVPFLGYSPFNVIVVSV